MALIDLDDEFLDLFYNITNSEVPPRVELVGLKVQLVKIVDTLKELERNSVSPETKGKPQKDIDELSDQYRTAILIVDDLGVITYQLKVLLSKFDIDIECSQNIYDAVNKFKQRKYKYVVMDLFVPTEREGFILLTELRKLAVAYDVQIVVGVITASPRKEIELQCKMHGADFFLEKNNNWQNKLLTIMEDYIKNDSKKGSNK